MSVLPELERQLIDAAGMRAGAAARGPGARRRRLGGGVAVALGCAVVAAVVLVFAFTGSNPGRRAPVISGHRPVAIDPSVPATYAAACAQTSDCVTVPPDRVPAALRGPFHVPRLAAGARCPTTSGARFDNSELGGVRLGTAPVRPDIANAGDLIHGRIVLGTTNIAGWYGIKTVWYSVPSYTGPWSVRAVRLSGRGAIDLSDEPAPRPGPEPDLSGGSRFSPTGIVVPPGDTLNTGAGYRTDPRTTWITAPGCYAFQVNGLGFSELIVFQALAHRWPPG